MEQFIGARGQCNLTKHFSQAFSPSLPQVQKLADRKSGGANNPGMKVNSLGEQKARVSKGHAEKANTLEGTH